MAIRVLPYVTVEVDDRLRRRTPTNLPLRVLDSMPVRPASTV